MRNEAGNGRLRWGWRDTGWLLLPLLAGACNSPRAAAWNLSALLPEDGHLRHLAPLRTGIDQLARDLFPGKFTDEDDVVEDPSLEALHQLLVLRAGDEGSLSSRLMVTRTLVRYASACPGRLARERAVLELGPLALELKLTDLPRPALEAAGGEEVALAFQALKSEAVQGGTDAALALNRMPLDLEGIVRLMEALQTLLERRGIAPASRSAVAELGLRLLRDSVGLALGEALLDGDPLVRAAAFEAMGQAFGDAFLLEALESLRPARFDDKGTVLRTARFHLPPVAPGESRTVERILDLVAQRGPSLVANFTEGRQASGKLEILRLLLGISHDAATFDGFARSAALRAANRLAPEGPRTRRREEWEAWWRLEAARLKDLGA